MRVRYGRWLLVCCAALAACTAASPKGPDTSVTTPAVGRPPAPQSVQAALSGEAFTAYASLGESSNDGLAPGDGYAALHNACMNDGGYGQYADSTELPPRTIAASSLSVTFPFGPWGYLGTAAAEQYGFGGGMLATNSPDPFAGLPAGPQAAAGKCLNIETDFVTAEDATSLAGIGAMSNAISSDVVQDPSLKDATKAWSACMARNGYTTPDPVTLTNQETRAAFGSAGSGQTTPQNRAQIAAAVADAHCTEATDLAGIYFAVQASYEQQLVSANQQALSAAVRQYKAGYARELSKLPALLRTTSATPETGGSPGS